MAGIYIHVPFCHQACHYCDFHFSTNLKLADRMTDALTVEIKKRRDYLSGELETIYFGGGTPSLLPTRHIRALLKAVFTHFKVKNNPEITLEANPEDLTMEKLETLREVGINRLSVGIQTFDSDRLRWMNRAHDRVQAASCVSRARQAGYENISVDLIYAIPEKHAQSRDRDLEQLIALSPEHVSFYGLTIEPKTVFGHWEKGGKLTQVDEDVAAREYIKGIHRLESAGYRHYEVSNLAKPGFESRHNTNYWLGKPYLGIGPGAHSFDGTHRHMNIRNNPIYIKKINEGTRHYEVETISASQAINETILTRLRTSDGLAFADVKGYDVSNVHQHYLTTLADDGLIQLSEAGLKLTTEGFLYADSIALELFLDT